MDQLNELTSVLNDIKRLSQEIISKILPFMEELAVAENAFVAEILRLNNNINEATASNLLQKTALKLVKDAKLVQTQWLTFVNAVTQGNKAIKNANCPFFQQIWYGDMYDQEGIDGMKMFKIELENQLNRIDEDEIVRLALDSYSKGGLKLLSTASDST